MTDTEAHLRRLSIARNASGPGLARRLAASDDDAVAVAAASIRACPTDVLESLAARSALPETVIAHAACPVDLLVSAASSRQATTVKAAASNPGCPPEALRVAARNEDDICRRAAAGNPNFRRRFACQALTCGMLPRKDCMWKFLPWGSGRRPGKPARPTQGAASSSASGGLHAQAQSSQTNSKSRSVMRWPADWQRRISPGSGALIGLVAAQPPGVPGRRHRRVLERTRLPARQ